MRLLGDKSIIFEKQVSRIYPQKSLFSHVIGQIDDSNTGISGLEKSLDNTLKKTKKKIRLTLDSEIQFLVRQELIRAEKFFRNIGSAAILMNINNGKILSLVSMPDFDLNKRQDIKDRKFINRVTKAVYELGSTFKTFTLAAGFNENAIDPDTPFLNLENANMTLDNMKSEIADSSNKNFSISYPRIERRLRNGDINIREFIRLLAKSNFYKLNYFASICNIIKFIIKIISINTFIFYNSF